MEKKKVVKEFQIEALELYFKLAAKQTKTDVSINVHFRHDGPLNKTASQKRIEDQKKMFHGREGNAKTGRGPGPGARGPQAGVESHAPTKGACWYTPFRNLKRERINMRAGLKSESSNCCCRRKHRIFPFQRFKAQLWCKLPWWRHTAAVLQDGGFNVEVVQPGRVVSPPAVFTPRGAPVDVGRSSELHPYGADLGLLLELKGDLSCDPVTAAEAPALVIHVIIDVEVCYRLLEHYLKST